MGEETKKDAPPPAREPIVRRDDRLATHVLEVLEIIDRPGFPEGVTEVDSKFVRAFADVIMAQYAGRVGRVTISRAMLDTLASPDECRLVDAAEQLRASRRRSKPRRGTLQRAQEDLAALQRRAGITPTPRDDPPKD